MSSKERESSLPHSLTFSITGGQCVIMSGPAIVTQASTVTQVAKVKES